MTQLVDNHNHILLASITEMIGAARSKGIVEFSITEHISQFRELREAVNFGSSHSDGRMFRRLDEYNDEFLKHIDEASGLKVNRGLEVDYSPRFEEQVGRYVNQESWEILLCSVHEFDNGRDIERNVQPYSEDETNETWSEYFGLQQLALESNFVPFNVLAHPVRMSRGRAKPPPGIGDMLLSLATTAKRRGKALELNGNDIGYAPHLVRQLAQACKVAECQVSTGSDAHLPKQVFRNLDAAQALVEEFDLQIYRPSGAR